MPATTYHHLEVQPQQDVLVLRITTKRLQDYSVANALRSELADAVTRSKATKVVIDFGSVENVSSVGYLPLLSLTRRLRSLGGRLIVCNLSDFVTEVFEATGLLIDSKADHAPFAVAADLPSAVEQLRQT